MHHEKKYLQEEWDIGGYYIIIIHLTGLKIKKGGVKGRWRPFRDVDREGKGREGEGEGREGKGREGEDRRYIYSTKGRKIEWGKGKGGWEGRGRGEWGK